MPETEGPPAGAVERAISKAVDTEGRSRVLKVIYLDDQGEPTGEWHSAQLPEDPFATLNITGIQEPPYKLEQLVFLAEQHPVHSAAMEQKTADIVGKGWEWHADDEDEGDTEGRDELEAWFESLAPPEQDMREVLGSVWMDVETTGWGLIECVRDPNGNIRRVFQVPGHTVRAHKSGHSLVQMRGDKRVWFRRWGAEDALGKPIEVDAKTGSSTTVRDKANDLFVIKKPARRSTWYGIPGYISAIGWITLALAARDDNLFLFQNRREPRWAIIMTNLTDETGLEEQIRRAFTVDLKSPHRNIIIPITGNGNIEFQKLSAELKQDGSFDKLSDFSNRMILVAHRTPPERIANSNVGPLGGNATEAASRVYKDGVVTAGQEVLNSRLNNFILAEYTKVSGKAPLWRVAMDDLDIETDREELDLAVMKFHNNGITLGEFRHLMKMAPLMKTAVATSDMDPMTGVVTDKPPTDYKTGLPVAIGEEIESELNELLFTQLPGSSGGAGSVSAMPQGAGGLGVAPAVEKRTSRTADILESEVRELLGNSRDLQDRLERATQDDRDDHEVLKSALDRTLETVERLDERARSH